MNTTLALTAVALGFPGLAAAQNSLIFSEYVEGSSNNKALEVFNATNASVDLSTVDVEVYFNGNATPAQSLTLSGTLAPGDVLVIVNGSANLEILAAQDVIATALISFNGDDAIVLKVNGTIVDMFGITGSDPGAAWTGGGISTVDRTLRRLPSVCTGDPNGWTDPSEQWIGFPTNTASGLGSHDAICATSIAVCVGANNSNGSPASISANGSRIVAGNDVTLTVSGLPTAGTTAMIFNSRVSTPVTIPNPAAGGTAGVPSDGNICIGGGTFGRHFQDIYIGTTGSFDLVLDLTDIPYPTAPGNYSATVLAGQTWYFQCWYRDAVLGAGRSNFSGAIGILFQ